MPRSPTPPKTYLQARALAASQLDFAMVLPCCSYVVSEPSPVNLSCPSSPECRRRESMGVCACLCRNVPRVLSTAGMCNGSLSLPERVAMDPPTLGDLLAQNQLGIVAQGDLQILLCRSIYEWNRCLWSTFFLHDMCSGDGISMHKKKDWKFLWGGSS